MAKRTKIPQSTSYLFKALIISAALNVIFLSFIFYNWMRERPPIPYYVLKPVDELGKPYSSYDQSNDAVIQNFKNLSLEQLIAKLYNKQLVENGYTQRDIALGSLVSFHHFNLAKALMGQLPSQARKISFHSGVEGSPVQEMIVYLGLSDEQYLEIIHYATTEHWPVTSQGLFTLLQKSEFANESTLADTFFMTPEFSSVSTLFSRTENVIDKNELLALLKEGDWSLLSRFHEEQKMAQDLSPKRRQQFLVDYIARNSAVAANLLIKSDRQYAEKKLDDRSVITILKLMQKNRDTEKFAVEMLMSPRSDAVWQQAALKLYEFAGITPPANFTRDAALAKFAPKALRKNVSVNSIPKKSSSVSSVSKINSLPTSTTSTKTNTTSAIKNVNPGVKTSANKSSKPAPSTPKSTVSTKQSQNPPKKQASQTKSSTASRKDKLYVVQQGDNLWKIAKRFNVDVDYLRSYNRLASDNLRPGSAVLIPEKK